MFLCVGFLRYKFPEELGRICINGGNGQHRLGSAARQSGVNISFLEVS